jgi:hypothetical protein
MEADEAQILKQFCPGRFLTVEEQLVADECV